MELSALTAISPVDGHYRNKTSAFSEYFSEYALIRYRVMVEVNYFIALCEIPLPQLKNFKKEDFDLLHALYEEFTVEDAEEIKTIELETNHDVKAVEYFLKRRFDDYGWEQYKEFIHFGLTSQDINNVALPLSIRDAHRLELMPALESLLNHIIKLAYEWADISMLARTHGQPASPTKLGKEFYVFAERLENQIELLKSIPFSAKFGGATGNFNAHHIAFPSIDWEQFACNLITKTLELHRQRTTTQIEHYDYLAAYFDALKRINTILLDLSRD
ncbi:MAG TPA: lyase family protein, partial [Bacteroidales bacterium]|nr:lyase family protein [Bacteroidales bacterium]